MLGLDDFNQIYKNVVENGYCFGTGIWSVYSKNIGMKLNQYGAYVPYLKNINQNITSDICKDLREITPFYPGNSSEKDLAKELFLGKYEFKYNTKLGYYKNLYIGHVNNDKFRMNSSSGGMVTWILTELMKKKEIDAVIHIKHVKNNQDGIVFKYGISTTIEDVFKNAKTKYYPVEMSEVLNYVKTHSGKYAIVGLPSYIYAVRLLQQHDHTFKERIKYCIGLICGHQKTKSFAEYLAWQCGVNPDKIADINFRKKLPNKKASSYAIEFWEKGKDKSVVEQMKNLKGGNWGQGYFKLKASDFTDDVMNETADVTLGDAWLDKYTWDYKGNNVIIVRNKTIDNFMKNALEKEELKLDLVDENEIIKSQRSHFRHTQGELPYRIKKVENKGKWYPQLNADPRDANKIPIMRKKIQDQRELIRDESHKQFLIAKQNKNIKLFDASMQPLCKKYFLLYKIYGLQRAGIKGILLKAKAKLFHI